jgi:hypothetical protein
MTAETKLARLRAKAPALANLVQEGRLTLNEAWGAFKQRLRDNSQKAKPPDPLLADFPPKLRGDAEWERKHIEFVKRRDAFNALSRAEQVEIARYVLDRAPDLDHAIRHGYKPLFEAFHEIKEAEAFLAAIEKVKR